MLKNHYFKEIQYFHSKAALFTKHLKNSAVLKQNEISVLTEFIKHILLNNPNDAVNKNITLGYGFDMDYKKNHLDNLFSFRFKSFLDNDENLPSGEDEDASVFE